MEGTMEGRKGGGTGGERMYSVFMMMYYSSHRDMKPDNILLDDNGEGYMYIQYTCILGTYIVYQAVDYN